MANLSFRTSHRVKALGDGRSIVGSNPAGVGHYVQDAAQRLELLNDILDGTLREEQVIEQIVERMELSLSEAEALLSTLIRLGHVELAAPSSLGLKEQERFSRSTALYSWLGGFGEFERWGPQESICTSRVCVLGAGGIGSNVAMQLVASGVGQITIVDFDAVELSNLNRQLAYSEASIGKSKVLELKKRLTDINSDCNVVAIDRKIEGISDLEDLFKMCDLVIRAIDSPPESAYWVSSMALEAEIPWIDCSYAGPMAVCATFVPGVTGCYVCLRDNEHRRLSSENALGLFDEVPVGVNAALAPIVSIAGSLATLEALRFLVSGKNFSMGKVLHQNLADYSNQYSIDIPSACEH